MKLPRNVKIFRGQLDMAPFMGVFLLLLLFVMFQQNISFVPGLRVQLPAAAGLPGIQGPAISLVMDTQGQVYFDNQLLKTNELRGALETAVKRAGQPVTLIIRADRNVALGAWTELNIVARAAGVREVLLAVQPWPTTP